MFEIKTNKFSYELPATIDPSSKFLFFLHGKFAEFYGPNSIHPNFGIYDYHGNVRAFAKHDFVVISEIRCNKTNPYRYAGKVARQVKTLLANCVSPENITVAGFGKGGLIAIYTSARLKNPDVKFVVMSGCSSKGVRFRRTHINYVNLLSPLFQGHFLSIHDVSDVKCNICHRVFDVASEKITFKEVIVKEGLARGLFYQPREAWIEPVVEWIKNKH